MSFAMTPWELVKKGFFKCDAEFAHRMVVEGIAGLNDTMPLLLSRLSGLHAASAPQLRPEVFGMTFASALGLAAGFDKNAEIVSALPHLGFGFCEIGTVTPLAQAGNSKPRLLREASTQSLFNRMGFNNDGAIAIAERLERHKKRLPPNFRVGVNIGKNKDTEGGGIALDYARAASPFLDLADFFVINVSSPNTPGLRALQAKESLGPIIDAVNETLARAPRRIPVLVKLAPELEPAELQTLIEFFESKALAGLVLTNTLGGEAPIGPGGWSGGRVRSHAENSLMAARACTKLPIVSVGGIDSVGTAAARLAEGAQLVELYSSWIYKGPTLPVEISSRL